MKKKSTTSNKPIVYYAPPEVGMGATIQIGSDSIPATIIQVTRNNRRVVVQEDLATRTDNNGMSDSQQYTYQADPQGAIYIATLRKDGKYRLEGGKTPVTLGFRRKYYDYSF
jgi:hypothetical protein